MPILQRLYSLLRRVTALETNGVAWTRKPAVDYIDFETQSVEPAFVTGRAWGANGALNVCTDIAGSIIQVGEELQCKVVNKSGVKLLNGTPVYVSGAQGNRPKVGLPINTDDSTFICIGLVTADIEINQEGRVVVEGICRDMDTEAYMVGDLVYVGSTLGKLTNVRPEGTSYYCAIGLVLVAHKNFGQVIVHVRRTERLGGTTTKRPTNPRIGWIYFDTSLGVNGKPIWWTGTVWVDATGTTV